MNIRGLHRLGNYLKFCEEEIHKHFLNTVVSLLAQLMKLGGLYWEILIAYLPSYNPLAFELASVIRERLSGKWFICRL